MAPRSSSVVASHRKKPRPAISSAEGAWRIGRPRPRNARQEIELDRLPRGRHSRAPVLPAAPRDPLLRRKGGRDHRAREVAALQAGQDLVDGAAAQQRVDLLAGEVRAAQRGQQRRAGSCARAIRCPAPGCRAPAAAAATSQVTAMGPATPTSGAAASSAPAQVIGNDANDGHAAARSSTRTPVAQLVVAEGRWPFQEPRIGRREPKLELASCSE